MEVPPFLQFPHLTSRLAHQVGQRDMGRTDIGAASAVHAVLRMEGVQALRRVFLQGPDHKDGGEVHGADGDALPTPNTDGGSLFPGLLPGGQIPFPRVLSKFTVP